MPCADKGASNVPSDEVLGCALETALSCRRGRCQVPNPLSRYLFLSVLKHSACRNCIAAELLHEPRHFLRRLTSVSAQNSSSQPTAHHSAQGHMTRLGGQDRGGVVSIHKCAGMVVARRFPFRPTDGMSRMVITTETSRFAIRVLGVTDVCSWRCLVVFGIIFSHVLNLFAPSRDSSVICRPSLWRSNPSLR